MPLYWILFSHTILMMVFCLRFCLEGVGLLWTWSLFLHWSRIDEFLFGLKSVDELCYSPPGSADTIANRPRGRFAGTNHINFQVTQPGSSTDNSYWHLFWIVTIKSCLFEACRTFLLLSSFLSRESRDNNNIVVSSEGCGVAITFIVVCLEFEIITPLVVFYRLGIFVFLSWGRQLFIVALSRLGRYLLM
jgi:hypothetical protein